MLSIDFSNPNAQGNTYFELKDGAEIKTAPGGSFSALRIDRDGPYALVPGLNISPSQMTNCTLMIGLYLESIGNNNGWVLGHEDSGFDRSIVMHDARFANAISSAVGRTWTAWNNPGLPPLHEWIHVTAVFRQGGESYVFLNGIRSDRTVIANNSEGMGDLWIGRARWSNHWTDSWIKEVRVFDHAVSDEDVESYAEAFIASTVVHSANPSAAHSATPSSAPPSTPALDPSYFGTYYVKTSHCFRVVLQVGYSVVFQGERPGFYGNYDCANASYSWNLGQTYEAITTGDNEFTGGSSCGFKNRSTTLKIGFHEQSSNDPIMTASEPSVCTYSITLDFPANTRR